MVYLFDEALKLAESEKIQNRIEILKARMLYLGISAAHSYKYVNGTEDERARITELYAEMHRLFLKHNIVVASGTPATYAPEEYDVTRSPAEHWFPGING